MLRQTLLVFALLSLCGSVSAQVPITTTLTSIPQAIGTAPESPAPACSAPATDCGDST
ncbi:MAG TPA: hypothetical protein VN841_22105 [Bryobacteraceae bacterium]|nr:hypothetical protein [Bryobacteraceae bacterium]